MRLHRGHLRTAHRDFNFSGPDSEESEKSLWGYCHKVGFDREGIA
jgi:hypothetical protein